MMHPEPIAVLGGAFDPITLGHLRIAQRVEQEGLRVLFMPCGDTHSFGKKMLPAPERVRMAELAAPGRVTDAEIRANSPYAEATYKILTATFGDVYWIIGSDNANSMHKWHHGEQLKRLIKFVVVHRPGHPLTDAGRWCLEAPHRFLPLSDVGEVSSTAVRTAIANGDWESAETMLPPAVLHAIRNAGWYASEARPTSVGCSYGVASPQGE